MIRDWTSVRVEYDEAARWVIVHRGLLRVAANLAKEPQVVPARAAKVLFSTQVAETVADGLALAPESAAVVRVSQVDEHDAARPPGAWRRCASVRTARGRSRRR